MNHYSVEIRKNETGEIKIIPITDMPWDSQGSLWYWTEGNFGCDCNREMLFEGKDIDKVMCSDGRFTILRAIFPDRSSILIDEVVA